MTIFKHIRTGQEYEIVCEALLKNHDHAVWLDTIVVYRSLESGRIFARVVEDFDKNFIEVTE